LRQDVPVLHSLEDGIDLTSFAIHAEWCIIH
jgi:hypothetical protein